MSHPRPAGRLMFAPSWDAPDGANVQVWFVAGDEMDWNIFYTELKGWQGAIGSVLGFGALIAGALFNFHLNRKRDERLRGEETVAVASALYGEIILMRRSVARMANAVGSRFFSHGLGGHRGEPYDRHFVDQYALPEFKLYPSLASKVGILPSQLALEVVGFYARVEEAQTWLSRLKSDEERGFTYSVNYVLDPAIDAVTGIGPALMVIEDMAGIVEPARLPDIRKAVEAQEFENMQNER